MRVEPDRALTVVIPVFNRSRELVRALQSLVAQSDSEFDVIVCDDGSTESIESVVREFYSQLRLRLLRIENSGGPARPRNVATQAATTRWISYLDSDDWWFPNRIAIVKGMLDDSVDIVYHPLVVHRADRGSKAKPRHGAQVGEALRMADPLWHMVKFGNPLPTSGTTIRRSSLIEIGGFDERPNLVSVEDFDAWLRLVAKGARVRHIPEVLGIYWVGMDQISVFNARQFDCQRALFDRQLNSLPTQYRAQAKSNFSYLLGSYALELSRADAQVYFRDISFRNAPLRWMKARYKLWRASRRRVGER